MLKQIANDYPELRNQLHSQDHNSHSSTNKGVHFAVESHVDAGDCDEASPAISNMAADFISGLMNLGIQSSYSAQNQLTVKFEFLLMESFYE